MLQSNMRNGPYVILCTSINASNVNKQFGNSEQKSQLQRMITEYFRQQEDQQKDLVFGVRKLQSRCFSVHFWRIQLLLIKIMSKKPQPQKSQNPKIKTQPVDQQNEPFLRALQKKVRNINKKLAEIADLETKDSLKPQQVEKINRKDALIEERTKVEENATFFKQVYAENAAHYRNNQLKELQVLARTIAIYHAAPQNPEQTKLLALWKALQQPEHHANLNATIASLSAVLKDFANDRKLQKSLANYTQKQGNEEIKPVESNQEKVANEVLQEKPEKTEVKVQQPQEPPAKVEAIQVNPPAEVQAPVVQHKPEPVVQKLPEVQVPKVFVQQEATPIAQEPLAPTQDKQQAVEKKQGERREYKNRDNRDRPYRGNGNRERKEGEGERRQYKPKYEEKKAEKEVQEGDDSEQSEEVRKFRGEEIKKLQEDGFIVVGKPKPKPKDPHEQQRAHEKQHGKKYHPHHQAGNH